ncbi:YchJ family protein [Acinetobacter sp. MD2]|uniref:YchJ family protein n=1 Tax=Acinetobacter sp. MD2 TaxID=2600066 RepID=UPI002D1F2054|nr:YchJ family protein [Acinetobacter sp. MD2]MEB3766909.1 YchJ family protein [Acinetobacter sp. MD2]
MNDLKCPCGHGSYVTCCEPLHLRQAYAGAAEQLMRSRYSAFAKQQIDYIIQTTAIGQQAQLDAAALAAWSTQNEWNKLEIVAFEPKIGSKHAMVEFKAYYVAELQPQVHHEQSYFVQYQQHWYFLDPTVDAFPTMKQVCLCGSGKKYKHCCAPFID